MGDAFYLHFAKSTQNQALNALVFFYDKVLEQPLDDIGNFARAKRPRRLPVVLTQSEVAKSHQKGQPVGQDCQKSKLPRPAPQFCHTSSGKRL